MDDSNLRLTAEDTDVPLARSNGRIWLRANFVIGLSFFLVFCAFSAVQNLASVVIKEDGLGSTSVAVIYCVLTAGSVIAPAFVRRFGTKIAIFCGEASFCLYVAANLYPQFYTLIPTAVILGFGAAILWTAQGAYITYIARAYAFDRGEKNEDAIALFTGMFWGMFQTTQIVGNVISWVVLGPYGSDIPSNISRVLYGTFTGLVFCGLLASLLLRSIPKSGQHGGGAEKEEPKTALETLTSNLRIMFDWRVALLIPVFVYSGLEQAWGWGTFTGQIIQSPGDVGKYMLVFGSANVFCSILFGRLGSNLTRISIIVMIGFLCQSLVAGTALYLGYPEVHDKWMVPGNITTSTMRGMVDDSLPGSCIDGCWGFYVGAALWGIGDAVWNTQLSNLLSQMFKDQASDAFGHWKMWQAVATAAAFFYSPHLDSPTGFRINTGIAAVMLIFGTTGILVLVLQIRRRTMLSGYRPIGINSS